VLIPQVLRMKQLYCEGDFPPAFYESQTRSAGDGGNIEGGTVY
jgi:hypothetical protein